MRACDSKTSSSQLELLKLVVDKARSAGAEAAEALTVEATSLSVSWRAGALESLEQAETGDVGLRVLIGKKQAIVSTSDRNPKSLDDAVDRAVAMAKAAPEDEFCGLAEPDEIAKSWPDLEQADAYDVDAPRLIERARQAEAAALAVKGVTQCESTDASASQAIVAMVASNGFSGAYRRTSYGLSASVLAGEGTAMERDYDFTSSVYQLDLDDAAMIGRQAAERTVRSLGARKMPTSRVPVFFEPRVASSLLGHLASAISGSSVARGTSFLKDKMGQRLFPESVSIIDDPFRRRGLRSCAFDGEGIAPARRKIIDEGALTTWLLDLRSARQLKLKSTGHASRGVGGMPSPSPSNFYMEAGTLSPEELRRDVKEGFYVTELMGMGVSLASGHPGSDVESVKLRAVANAAKVTVVCDEPKSA
ncbi:MAG: TldD/PmbA family protein [Alphaproteobacteria bacterium]|nr:TldD/PmbA family protein [Alphaproteobacteria bacterium]